MACARHDAGHADLDGFYCGYRFVENAIVGRCHARRVMRGEFAMNRVQCLTFSQLLALMVPLQINREKRIHWGSRSHSLGIEDGDRASKSTV
jgi:hypothetical protein